MVELTFILRVKTLSKFSESLRREIATDKIQNEENYRERFRDGKMCSMPCWLISKRNRAERLLALLAGNISDWAGYNFVRKLLALLAWNVSKWIRSKLRWWSEVLNFVDRWASQKNPRPRDLHEKSVRIACDSRIAVVFFDSLDVQNVWQKSYTSDHCLERKNVKARVSVRWRAQCHAKWPRGVREFKHLDSSGDSLPLSLTAKP